MSIFTPYQVTQINLVKIAAYSQLINDTTSDIKKMIVQNNFQLISAFPTF